MRAPAPRLPNSAVRIFLWENIFAVVDNGRALPEEYGVLHDLIEAQAKRFPKGLGCLAIIPKDATPPTDAARKALNSALESVAGSLRCMCWLVEGSGFQGAMVRAVLTGLRIVAARAYATHVSTNMDEALAWMVTRLQLPTGDVITARQEINRLRKDAESGA